LQFKVEFDKTQLNLGDDVTCTVEAGRTDTSSTGMLIAEIGLPPGSEIDRDSIDQAIKNSLWEVSRYEVQPDRILMYLWPRWATIRFQFRFRPRFVQRAQTPPFVLYDYYNPDARIVVRPLRFQVQNLGAPPR
jgi:uncharacterized protein YfaS (alpha-2-macroglobulin family)